MGGAPRTLWDGQGGSRERVRLKPGLEGVRMLVNKSGGRVFHTGGAGRAKVLRKECVWHRRNSKDASWSRRNTGGCY